MTQYAKISKAYTKRNNHPQRQYMIYPSWLEVCGDVQGLRVLDMGCGPGTSSRFLAEQGGIVSGVDKEMEMIKLANKAEMKNPLGIRYSLGDAKSFYEPNEKYNLVSASMLFHYSKTKSELFSMMKCCADNLKKSGRLVAIVHDPNNPVRDYYEGSSGTVAWIGEPFVEGSELQLTANVKPAFTFREFYWWKKNTYEMIARKAGFTNIQWHTPKMNREGRRLFPDWKILENYHLVIMSAEKL